MAHFYDQVKSMNISSKCRHCRLPTKHFSLKIRFLYLFTLYVCTHTRGRLGVRQTAWQTDRQGEEPWLGNKGGTFPRWLASSLPSWLETKAWQFQTKPLWASIFHQLAHHCWTSSTSSRTCHITILGQSTLLAFFKLASPELGEENSSETFKVPALGKRLDFLAFWAPCFAEGLFSVCLLCLLPLTIADSVCCPSGFSCLLIL